MPRSLPNALDEWEVLYTHHDHDLVNDFYIPVLSNTITYNRITGYFRPSVLAAVSKGYETFCDHADSKMRLIVGLEMTKEFHDRVMYWEDPSQVEGEIIRIIENELSSEMPDFEKSRLAGLSWMLENDKLEVKFGVMLDKVTKNPIPWEWSKLHHKIASFTDECNPPNTATIIGSINETEAAWTRNGDSFETNISWSEGKRERAKISATLDTFDRIWNTNGKNENLNVAIYSISKLSERWKQIILPINPHDTEPWPGANPPESHETDVATADYDDDPRWVHQKTAVELFLEEKDKNSNSPPMAAGKQGILCMATGTGKTRTALKIVRKMFKSGEINKLVITTHKKDVLDQWSLELQKESRGLNSYIDYQYSHYGQKTESANFIFSEGKMVLLVGREAFHKLLESATKEQLSKTLLIVDECHNFRGESARERMDGNYQKFEFRLGLSATPENEYNSEATQFLYDEIGPIYFEFGLEDAISRGILCPFEYHPLKYMPTAEEEQKVRSIKRKYEGAIKKNPKAALSIEVRMRQDMADVYKMSVGKIPIAEDIIIGNPNILKRCIIFGPVKEFNESIKELLNQAQSMYGVKWTPYYGETDSSNLDWYRNGDVEVLLTCSAISEGVDLEVSNIILLSSDGTRLETIQRIGRALRTQGNDDKIANVYDFIRVNSQESADTRREEWLSELSKVGLKSRE